jgi:uncharacterized delta-60 repeat protein
LLLAQAGSLDPTFGTGGIVITPDMGSATVMALQSDAKIVVAGSVIGGPNFTQLGLARYNKFFFTPITGGIAALPDGKILAAVTGGFSGGVMVRLLANRQLDTSFGAKVAGPVELVAAAHRVSLLPGGKIPTHAGFMLAARYTPSGALDPNFGIGGQIRNFGGNAIIPLTNREFVAVVTWAPHPSLLPRQATRRASP